MLNAKTLKKLIIITILCSIPVVLITAKGPISAIAHKNDLFLPHLVKKPDQITKVVIQDNKQTLTLQKNGDTWEMLERNNYPVMTDKVLDLLYNLADLKIIEPKTSNPAFFRQLDINDVSEPESRAVLVSISDVYNDCLAQIYIGKRESVRIGEDYQEHIFVRRANEEQAWLVAGIIPVANDFRDWFEQPLLGIVESDLIKRVEIEKNKNSKVIIAKSALDAEDFVLETASAKSGMILDLDAVNTVPFEFAELEFVDVLPAAKSNIDWKNSLLATVETFPGVKVILNLVRDGDKVLAQVKAFAPESAKYELLDKVELFNRSKEPWVYVLSPESYKELALSNDDFLKPIDLAPAPDPEA